MFCPYLFTTKAQCFVHQLNQLIYSSIQRLSVYVLPFQDGLMHRFEYCSMADIRSFKHNEVGFTFHFTLAFQHGLWKWNDGSTASHTGWGLQHLPHDYNPRLDHDGSCITSSSSYYCTESPHGVFKLHTESPGSYTQPTALQNCAAFHKFSGDVSIFPINCTSTYWSRILCEDYTVEDDKVPNPIHLGRGGFWMDHHTLRKTKYVCSEGYYLVLDNFCIRLILTDHELLKYDSDFSQSFCEELGFRKMNNSVDVSKFGDVLKSHSVIYKLLDEFFVEGADIVNGNKVNKSSLGGWLPAAHTYIPCLSNRELTPESPVTDVQVHSCADDSVIAEVLLCNGNADCKDSEDESISLCSSFETYLNDCTFPLCACSMFYYQCEFGGCLHYDQVCDSLIDCPGGDDETLCHDKRVFDFVNSTILKVSFITDLCNPPAGDILMCRSRLQCYNASSICRYDHSDGVMADCEDGSHLGKG